MDTIQHIPIRDIVEPVSLMRLVDKGSLDYLEMYYSIQDYGFLNSLSVRLSKRYPGKYEIMDGLWRFTVARQLQLETVPCIIKDIDDDTTVLFVQIQANAIRPETKLCEYAAHLARILKSDPDMSLITLAGRLRKHVDWIRATLSLNRLIPAARKSVDRGEIPVKSARLLARIPRPMQDQFLDQARIFTYQDFAQGARKVLKEFREAQRKGIMKSFYDTQYIAHPYLRPMGELIEEMEHVGEGGVYLATENLTPIEAWKRAIEWVLHLDPKGVLAQEMRYGGMKEQVKINTERRQADREQLRELEDSILTTNDEVTK